MPLDVVLGHMQLAVIKPVFRDLKHRWTSAQSTTGFPNRIRAHVLLCRLAMLRIRVAESETEGPRFQLKKALLRMLGSDDLPRVFSRVTKGSQCAIIERQRRSGR